MGPMDVRSENFQSPSVSGGAGFRAFRGLTFRRRVEGVFGLIDCLECSNVSLMASVCPRIDEGPKVPVPTGFDASSKSIPSNLSDLDSHQSHRTYHRRSVRSVLSVPKTKGPSGITVGRYGPHKFICPLCLRACSAFSRGAEFRSTGRTA